MKLAVKITVMFVLLMLSFSIRGEAVNFMVLSDKDYSTVCYSTSEAFETSETPVLDSGSNKAYDADRIHLSSFSDIELGFKPVTETYSFFNSQRMRRAIEISDFFKNLAHALCLRENLLVINKNMSYQFGKALHSSQSSCDYYIFALRRILI